MCPLIYMYDAPPIMVNRTRGVCIVRAGEQTQSKRSPLIVCWTVGPSKALVGRSLDDPATFSAVSTALHAVRIHVDEQYAP